MPGAGVERRSTSDGHQAFVCSESAHSGVPGEEVTVGDPAPVCRRAALQTVSGHNGWRFAGAQSLGADLVSSVAPCWRFGSHSSVHRSAQRCVISHPKGSGARAMQVMQTLSVRRHVAGDILPSAHGSAAPAFILVDATLATSTVDGSSRNPVAVRPSAFGGGPSRSVDVGNEGRDARLRPRSR